MPSSTFTNAGVNYINSRIADGVAVLGNLKLAVGTGRRAVSPAVASLQTPYQLAGQAHFLDLLDMSLADVVPQGGGAAVPAARFEFRDGVVAAAYAATELGVYDSTGATLLAYIALDAAETHPLFVKGQNGISTLHFFVRANAITAQSFDVTVSTVATSQASTTSHGTVQLTEAADPVGATTVWTAQTTLARLRAALSSVIIPKASATEVDTGTNADKAVTPAALAGSRYRRNYIANRAPANSEGADGDTWDQY
ncbi:MAG: hypothetical protein OXC69_03255 [Candidatus Tectomicrobia bacterium]|nr:hypothetical protein [Candidatus Tectomicrobia bacterium]